jgi:hypothetical protein
MHDVSSVHTCCLVLIPINSLQAGCLVVGGVRRPLFEGINGIGRRSRDEEHNCDQVDDWQEELGGPVLMLAGRGISRKHAIICESNTMKHAERLLRSHNLLSSARFYTA